MSSLSNEISAIIILLVSFLGLVFLGLHIAYAILLSSMIVTIYLGIPVMVVTQNLVRGINVYALMAVPFFILAGEIMMKGGITERLLRLAASLVGWFRGSLYQVAIVACLLFGTVSGSSAAGTASIGGMMVPRMKEKGYDDDVSTSACMTASVICMLIPPSHNMVLFALAAGQVSIASLFLAGIVPGFLLSFILGAYCYFIAKKRNYPKGEPFKIAPVLKSFKEAIPGLFTIVIVFVGVVGGFFTATEAAAIAVFYALIVGIFFYREIKIKELPGIFVKALRTIAIVLILIGASACFSWLIAFLRVPQHLSAGILSLTENPIIILILLNLIMIAAGMFMDMAALILILTPILLPVATSLGMHPVQFCMVLIINLGMGLITPPVGGTLFIGSAISGIKIGRLTKAMLPFYAVMIVAVMLITFVPFFSMWLPGLFM